MNHDSDSEDVSASDAQIRSERLAIRKRAMDMLARREHAPAELAAKLRKRDYADNDINVVLDELIGDNLLSSSRYAHALVASRGSRGIGPLRIRNELAAAGIDDGLADEALCATDIDWPALAESVRIKRFGAAPPRDFPAKAKQMRFLQQRGFGFEHIQAAFDD